MFIMFLNYFSFYINNITNTEPNTPPNVVSNISEIEYFAPKYFFWQNSQ